MKWFIVFTLFFFPMIQRGIAEEPDSSSRTQAGPGPGKALPKNSKVTPPPNLTGLRERATYIADQIKEQSVELLHLFAILALIYAGYHAQFRGLEEFVSTILRVIVAFALLSSFKEILPYFFEARKEFIGSLPLDTVDATLQVGTMIGTIGLGTILMGPVGIGFAVATLIAALGILIVYSAQLLFEAILIAFTPLAIACIAFRHTHGIFTAWFKTFVAVLLVPMGWTIAMLLGKNIYGWNSDSLSQNTADFGASLIYTAAAGAIYMGMPILTVWLVNKASGAAAAAMPSPLQLVSSYISRGISAPSLGAGSSGVASSVGHASSIASTLQGTNMGVSSPITHPNISTQPLSGSYGERIQNAQKHHHLKI